MLNEAILIRSTYSFVKASRSEIDTLWQSYDGKIGTSRDEGASILDEYYSSQWKYRIAFATDPNPYTADAWIGYMKGDRPTMPDLGSPPLVPICYDGKRDVVLDDGSSATVYGQICYMNGQYEFIQ
ncbi:MAG: hypothetical protein IPK68_04070 [Bdellovibrionales bacterium]|nr:hypothetical protein [Bdellovibrionales bacterium]